MSKDFFDQIGLDENGKQRVKLTFDSMQEHLVSQMLDMLSRGCKGNRVFSVEKIVTYGNGDYYSEACKSSKSKIIVVYAYDPKDEFSVNMINAIKVSKHFLSVEEIMC